jgi:hypothetical protein
MTECLDLYTQEISHAWSNLDATSSDTDTEHGHGRGARSVQYGARRTDRGARSAHGGRVASLSIQRAFLDCPGKVLNTHGRLELFCEKDQKLESESCGPV